MSSQRAIRRLLSPTLALSLGLWVQCALAMPLAASQALQCHAAMAHAHHAMAAIPCCPSSRASAVALLFDPPCCDLSSQPARPPASVAVADKFRSGQLSANNGGGTAYVFPRLASALGIAASPPFLKPVFELKTDLRT